MSDPHPQDSRPFVLIADDDPDTLDILCFLAERKGWRVERATTARGIIERVNLHCAEEGQCPDAILSDVNFFDNQPGPRLTGITAIGQIRKKWPHIPVVFYSAFLNSPMRELIKGLGNAVAVEKLGHAMHDTGPVGAIERVEAVMAWGVGGSAGKYEGPDRRKALTTGPHPRRRQGECGEEEAVGVPHVLEQAMTEARALRELHAVAAGGGEDWGATRSK